MYSSVDDLIARERFDAAILVLPANEIPRERHQAPPYRKHIFMEKQFGRTAADLARLVQVVKGTGVVCQAGYPWRSHPAVRDLRQLIVDGKLGRPLTIEGRVATTQVRPGLRDPKQFLYTRENEGGGILHMLGGHLLDVMRFLMDCEVSAVQAITGRTVGYMDSRSKIWRWPRSSSRTARSAASIPAI